MKDISKDEIKLGKFGWKDIWHVSKWSDEGIKKKKGNGIKRQNVGLMKTSYSNVTMPYHTAQLHTTMAGKSQNPQ